MAIQTCTVGAHTVRYRLISRKTWRRPHDISILANEWDGNPEAALERHTPLWHLREEFRNQPLRERWLFTATNLRQVAIYNFAAPLTKEQQGCIRRALSVISSMVRNPHWNLQRIYIRADQLEENIHSGLPYRGIASYEHALGLFPYVMNLSRDVEPDISKMMPAGLTELEATILHECGHIMVEPYVKNEWIGRMGWIAVSDYPAYDIQRPDGFAPAYVCLNPEACVRDYSKTSPSEDIADSVAAYAYRPEVLRGDRQSLLEIVLKPPSKPLQLGKLRRSKPNLPRYKAPNIVIDGEANFTPLADVPAPPEKKHITVDAFIEGIRNGTIMRPIVVSQGLQILTAFIGIAAAQL